MIHFSNLQTRQAEERVAHEVYITQALGEANKHSDLAASLVYIHPLRIHRSSFNSG